MKINVQLIVSERCCQHCEYQSVEVLIPIVVDLDTGTVTCDQDRISGELAKLGYTNMEVLVFSADDTSR